MKKYLLLLLCCCAVRIHAQNKVKNGNITGFFSGIAMQSFGIQPLDSREPEVSAVRPGRPGAGVSSGVFFRKPLWKGLDFQPEIAVSYFRNSIRYRQDGLQNLEFLDLELPLHLVAVDRRRADFPLRACVIFGPRLGWNLLYNPENRLKLARERLGMDLGLGAEIRAGAWRLQPMLMYSHGMNNLHLISDTRYDSAVGKVFRDILSLRLACWYADKKN